MLWKYDRPLLHTRIYPETMNPKFVNILKHIISSIKFKEVQLKNVDDYFKLLMIS